MVVTLPGLDREARDHDPSRPPRHNRSGGRAQPHRRPGNARSSHPSRLVARRSEVDGGRPGWLAPAGRTPQRVRAPSLAAAAVGLAALGWTGGLGPALPTLAAGAAPAVHCSTGVVVVADFAPWGGDINSVCDATLPANASEALVAARFHPTGVAAYGGLNFICQIAGDPPHVTCASTPPANAYWSFGMPMRAATPGRTVRWVRRASSPGRAVWRRGCSEATPVPVRPRRSRHRTPSGRPPAGPRVPRPPRRNRRRHPLVPLGHDTGGRACDHGCTRTPGRGRWNGRTPPTPLPRQRHRPRRRAEPLPPRAGQSRARRPARAPAPGVHAGVPTPAPRPTGKHPFPRSSTPPPPWLPNNRRVHPCPSPSMPRR